MIDIDCETGLASGFLDIDFKIVFFCIVSQLYQPAVLRCRAFCRHNCILSRETNIEIHSVIGTPVCDIADADDIRRENSKLSCYALAVFLKGIQGKRGNSISVGKDAILTQAVCITV